MKFCVSHNFLIQYREHSKRYYVSRFPNNSKNSLTTTPKITNRWSILDIKSHVFVSFTCVK